MNHFEIEPRDPLVIGDGRSIGPNTMTGSLEVPFPSQVAGLIRTRLGTLPDGRFASERIGELRNHSLLGPVLERIGPNGAFYVPAPADALHLTEEGKPVIRRRLLPAELRAEEATDLPDDLLPVALNGDDPRKPYPGPRYWRWDHAERWLTAPVDNQQQPKDLGIASLDREERTHVALKSTRTAVEGALFRTDGIRYQRREGEAIERYALHFGWDGKTEGITGVASLGGERRLSVLRPSARSYPAVPKGLVESLTASRRARIWLLTPALFDGGYRPATFGDGVTLRACAVGRAATVSGWDHASNTPKRSRRCAPAGSIYWVELGKDVNVKDWVSKHWFNNISSALQDRRDGFGLAVLGVW